MRRMVAVVLLMTLGFIGFSTSTLAGVIATTHVRHSLTLDAVDIVPNGSFFVTPKIAGFFPELADLDFNGEGATNATGEVSVNNKQATNPLEIPSLEENGTMIVDLTAIAERSSSGLSFARALTKFQIEFLNLSGADATFHLTYVAEVSTSVAGADTLFNTRSGLSAGYGALIDDSGVMGSLPFQTHTINDAVGSVEAILNRHDVTNSTSSSTITESFSLTIGDGSEVFSFEAVAFAQANATVPEPGSLAIWSAGVLLLTRRRRRKS